jgi:hypothetical protein
MKVPRFDIFSGTDDNAQWIEIVEGLDNASMRMQFYAAKYPGKYFVFDCSEHTIAESIDTSPATSVTIEDVKAGAEYPLLHSGRTPEPSPVSVARQKQGSLSGSPNVR